MTREEAVAFIVPRLVEFYDPVRIYLFGSSARGDWTEDSDLDFMVLLPDDAPKEMFRASHKIDLTGTGYGKDILTWRVSEFSRRLHLRASFSSTIVDEGKLLYDRAAVIV